MQIYSELFLKLKKKWNSLNEKSWGRIFKKVIIPLISVFLLLKIVVFACPVSDKRFSGYPESLRIYDRNGVLLRESVNKNGARAQWIDFENISPWIIKATIAIEDKRFYSHSGIDFLAAFRASFQLLYRGRVISGASTISMQLARIIFGHSHNIFSKILQSFNAFRIERTLSKDLILEQYLNRVFFGSSAIGIEAASYRYFNKPNTHLSLAEASMLVGLIQAPSKLNPYNNLDLAINRKNEVLKNMLINNFISEDEYNRAILEPIYLNNEVNRLYAMHFTDYVLMNTNQTGDIFTTLDSDLQIQVEKQVYDHVKSFSAGGLTNASVLVVDNENGDILCMVGSSDYWNSKSGSVNGTISLRQPGSTLKPFTYALAFEKGSTPASIVPDIETEYIGSNGDLYIPRNYSKNFYGPVLMRQALGRSLNIPAIRTLNYVTIDSLLSRLHKIGFSSLNESAEFYGLGLTLGDGEITLFELVQGYAMFARNGLKCKLGFQKENHQNNTERVFSKEICFLITDILSDEKLRIQAFGVANPLLFDFPIALKTGTSANWRDNWVVGYTNKYTIAVWAGDFEGTPMSQFSGSVGAGPLFNRIANLVVAQSSYVNRPQIQKVIPEVQQIMVCPLSGKIPTENCPNSSTFYVISDSRPVENCSVHQKLKIDTRNGLLASGRCPSKYTKEKIFEILPPEYAEWQMKNNKTVAPTKYSPFCPAEGATTNALVITSPMQGEIYLIEPGYDISTQTIPFKGEVNPRLHEISWFIDGKKFTTTEWPYKASWPLKKGKHSIKMVGGGMESDKVDIEVR